jgi:cell division protein FtsW
VSARTTYVGASGTIAEATRASRQRHPSAPANKRRRPAPMAFWALATTMAVLTLLGLVMVFSSSSIMAIHQDSSGWAYFERQSLWASCGLVALVAAMKIPVAVWRRLVPLALGSSLVLMLMTLATGRAVNGARAWLDVGPVSFEPSELVKFALLLYGADLLARRADHMHDTQATLRPYVVVLGIAAILTIAQRDLGGAIVMAAIVLAVAFIGGSPFFSLLKTGLGLGLCGLLFVVSTPYRRARWTSFLDVAHHKQGSGLQVWQSLIGIASGGLTGAGLGASKAKWGYLPEAHTDFIFAIVAEELGLVGVVVVVALFLLLGFFGVRVALHAPDRFSMLVAGGVTAWLLTQAFINIGGVIGIMPLTGLTLPFVSFGGSSLLVTMAAAGLLLNVARTGR